MWKRFSAFSRGFLDVWFVLFIFMGIAINGIFLLYAALILLAEILLKRNTHV